MSRKPEYSKKIIKILAQKPAVAISEIMGNLDIDRPNPASAKATASKYAITRSIKGLQDAGLIEHIPSGQSTFARLTKEGRKKAHSIRLEGDESLVSMQWDGFWRIILLDLPEARKSEREALRYLLKKAGFVCVKNSVWISMYPYEHLFSNIKKDLGLSTELMIVVTDKLDSETEKEFLKLI